MNLTIEGPSDGMYGKWTIITFLQAKGKMDVDVLERLHEPILKNN